MSAFLSALRGVLPGKGVVDDADALIVYECDGFTIPRAKPLAVAFPRSTEEVVGVVNVCREHGVAVLPRGSGTGLTGGIVAVTPGVQVSTARMNRILSIDLANRCALVEAGATNGALSEAVKGSPYHYAPDPSSQRASTIGGNVATNAGGLHTLKHGVTVNHLLGVEVVTADGAVHTAGGPHGHDIGPDVAGLFCGSEGTLGLITKVWCRLTPRAAAFRTALAIFDSTRGACEAVSEIIGAGITPAALEMMDGPMIQIVEEAFHLGIPRGSQALLVIEVDGPAIAERAGLEEEAAQIEAICRRRGATSIETSRDPGRREALWSARKHAFGAIGRISPSYCTQDACVPRSKLPEVIAEIAAICGRHGLRATNVFHAGDGNVHPVLMYDEGDAESVQRALAASGEILRHCISVGGSLTGEHGVGIEKLPYMRDMYGPADLGAMEAVRNELVTGDLMNPYKVLPRAGAAIDLVHPRRKVPQ